MNKKEKKKNSSTWILTSRDCTFLLLFPATMWSGWGNSCKGLCSTWQLVCIFLDSSIVGVSRRGFGLYWWVQRSLFSFGLNWVFLNTVYYLQFPSFWLEGVLFTLTRLELNTTILRVCFVPGVDQWLLVLPCSWPKIKRMSLILCASRIFFTIQKAHVSWVWNPYELHAHRGRGTNLSICFNLWSRNSWWKCCQKMHIIDGCLMVVISDWTIQNPSFMRKDILYIESDKQTDKET